MQVSLFWLEYTFTQDIARIQSKRSQFICILVEKKTATIEGTFTEEDIKIVFDVDGSKVSTFFSKAGTGLCYAVIT